jgi:G patch domain and KOW motifs-containing protein
MNIKIVGKKKRKRKAALAIDEFSSGNIDIAKQKCDDNLKVTETKIIPLIKKKDDGVSKIDQTLHKGKDVATKKVSQVLQTLLANKSEEKAFKNEKERLQAQLTNCPEAVDTKNSEIFAEMPVEDFGMAMLRGMGWNPKQNKNEHGISNNNSNDDGSGGPDPFIPKARAGRLGLGAVSLEEIKKKKQIEGRKKLKRSLELSRKHNYKIGDLIEYKNNNKTSKNIEYGRIINVQSDNVKVVIGPRRKVMHLSLIDTNVHIKIVNKNSLPKSHYVYDNNNNNRGTASNLLLGPSAMAIGDSSDSNSDNNDKNKKNNVECNWLIPNIRVRINCQHVEGTNGTKYYAMKGVVRDVVQPKVCTLIMDIDGAILDNVKQEWLNSALPKKTGRVMILSGKRKFKSGQMLLRDKKKKIVHVKLDSSDKVKQFSYDEVAEYLG